MKLQYYFFFALICSCVKQPEKAPREFYVISKQDSIAKKSLVPPPPPPISALKFYSDIVFILGNNNKVYVYQTEKVYNYNVDESIDFKSPNFINLKPEYVVAIDSKSFIQFLKDNNDIFRFGVKGNPKLFYIASETDTIKNSAFFDIADFISNSGHKRITYLIRRTTEEENNVLQCKKNETQYSPQTINWSHHLLNDKFKPLTKEYINLESQVKVLRKAKSTFEKNANVIIPTL